MTAVTPPGPPGPTPTPTIRPHSMISRLLAVVMLVAVVAVGAGIAVVVISMSSSGDSSSASGWNTIVAVDRQTGEVTLLDADGERIDRISTEIVEPRAHVISDSHLVLEGVSIRSGDDRHHRRPVGRGARLRPRRRHRSGRPSKPRGPTGPRRRRLHPR